MSLLALVISVTLLVSFICSLVEAVLYSLPVTAVEIMLQKGSYAGAFFRRFKEDIQRPISAIVAMNSVVNTAGVALAAAMYIERFGSSHLLLFTLAMTATNLMLCEIFPKTVGVFYSRRLSGISAWIIQLMIWILGPLVFIIQKIMELVVPRPREAQITPQEIITLANLGRREGAIEFMEEKIIENILWLKLKKAAAIMTPRIVVSMLDAGLTLEEARAMPGGWPHSRLPVYEGNPDNITGFILGRDAFNLACGAEERVLLRDLLRPIHFVDENMRADLLLLAFLEKRQHLFGVKNVSGAFVGVVTLEDVLEEIIGREIVDELDPAVDMQELARRKQWEKPVKMESGKKVADDPGKSL